jgi:N,N'-diacetyllegionaminate synthase
MRMFDERKIVKFGDRRLGDAEPVFVTFEAGPTHHGLESAKRLVSYAAEAGADAVKFQMLDPDRLVSDRSQTFEFDVLVDRETGKTETIKEPLYDIFVRRALKPEEWRALKAHADKLNLAFFATAGFFDEIDFLAEIGCHSFKIASSDVNHLPLIRRAARTGMCLQLDTGNSTIGEIETAIDVIRAEGNENIIIHHCPSGYPARLEGINLNIITTLRKMFPYPVAFSDHSPGWDMDVAAVVLGANLVEKTISEDRTTRAVEHIFSVEPQDAKKFVEIVRGIEIALGSHRRIMHPAELKKRQANRRSTHLVQAARAGSKLGDLQVEFRRPGTGLSPADYEVLAERSLKSDLPAGHRLTIADLV